MDHDQHQQRQRGPVDYLNSLFNLRQGASFALRGAAAGIGGTAAWAVGITIGALVLTAGIAVFSGGQGAGSEGTTNPAETSINTTKTNLNVSFYCQYQDTWSANGCDIAHFGCDPTSLAIILASFGDTQWTPSYTAINNNYMGCFGATNQQQTLAAIDKMVSLGYIKGPTLATKTDFNLNLAKEYIKNGYLIHAAANVFFRFSGSLNNPTLSNGVHSFVITGVDPIAQTVTILDPTYCTSDTNYVTKIMNVYRDILSNSAGNGWFWAYPMKKVTNSQ